MALKLATAVHQVNLLLLLLQEQGDLASIIGIESHHRTTWERLFVRSPTQTKPNGKAQVVPFAFPYTHTTSTRKDDEPTVCYRQQWNPCHMDFGLVFQQAIDRQDRTQVEGRFNYWNTPFTGTLPQPDKDSLQADDMPCRPHPIEATPAPAGTTTSRQEARCSQDTPSHRAPLDINICPGVRPAATPLLSTGHPR